MRIVGGKYSGAVLVAPKGSSSRPTSGHVREAVFNVLAHGIEGPELSGARVIDLFAGTGALGLEALSRGAHSCLFVETDAAARGALQQNIETLNMHGCTQVFRRDALRLGPAGNKGEAQFVFLDPPYGRGLGERALSGLCKGNWLANGAIVIFEERALIEVAWPIGFELIDRRKYGDSAVHFARYVPGGDVVPESADVEGKSADDQKREFGR